MNARCVYGRWKVGGIDSLGDGAKCAESNFWGNRVDSIFPHLRGSKSLVARSRRSSSDSVGRLVVSLAPLGLLVERLRAELRLRAGTAGTAAAAAAAAAAATATAAAAAAAAALDCGGRTWRSR